MSFPYAYGDVLSAAMFNGLWQMAARRLAGDETFAQTDASYTRCRGAAIIEVDGDETETGEVHVTAKVDGGTGSVRLWNRTTSASMGAVDVTSTTFALVKITGITFTADINQYELQARRGTTWITIADAALLLGRS